MTTRTTDSLTVTTTQARKAILTAFKAKRPIFLWGPPGVGKSDVVASITEELGGYMIDLRMAQMEPTDVRGIPFFNKNINKMDWAEPIDLPDQELASQYPIIVLFLDELNSAPPAVQAAGYQLILNRRVGKYRLPDNVVIVAAGNRESDKGVTYRMPMPLANRFIHVEVRADFNSWQNWAVKAGIHQDVVGFLSFSKDSLYDFNAKSSSRAFATPRSWVFVSELLQDMDCDTDTLSNLVAGTIGEGLAIKFMAHRKVAAKMPNPTDILEGKVTTLSVKEISAMYSLTTSMCYELREAAKNGVDSKTFHKMAQNFFAFMMENFETELGVMGAKIALKTFKLPIEPSQLKNFDAVHKKYGKYIISSDD
jgi:hypothetical protein